MDTPGPTISDLKKITLRGELIDLRPHADSDYSAFEEVLNDQETMTALQPYFKISTWTEVMVKERYDKLRSDPSWLSFSVTDHKTHRLAGQCGFKKLDLAAHQCEFGLILHRSVWGQGFAQECFLLCLDLGFGPVGLQVIAFTTDDWNQRMKGFFRKLGIAQKGTVESSLYFELESSDWPRVRTLLKTHLDGNRDRT